MSGKLFLVGMPGSGKSTLSRLLARSLQCPFVDIDEKIVEKCGKSIATIFKESGEPAFRQVEHEILIAACQHHDSCVISTGGGVILREDNRELLKSNKWVVYLRASIGQLFKRTVLDNNRPLLQTDNHLETLKDLYSLRDSFYCEVAGLIIFTHNQTQQQIISQILSWIESEDI